MDSGHQPLTPDETATCFPIPPYIPRSSSISLIQSFPFNTSLGRVPSGGPTIPSFSIKSIKCAARPYPIRKRRCSVDVDALPISQHTRTASWYNSSSDSSPPSAPPASSPAPPGFSVLSSFGASSNCSLYFAGACCLQQSHTAVISSSVTSGP